ncbi:MAG: CoB--CoM heterodisulfide reductase iron-sulfur subunit B family protein [Thermoguttaceae bacterium]
MSDTTNSRVFGYYPGCALHGSSFDYERSVRACLEKLGVQLAELDDWICCGASAAHTINAKLATALPARNLAIAQRDGIDNILAPCPLCSMELIKVSRQLRESAGVVAEMSDIVELPVAGTTEVLNIIQVFQRIGLDTIKASAVQSLEKYKVACYYGCLLTRPPRDLLFDDPESPSSMETLLASLGATPIEWNFKTECCGAGLTLADSESVETLTGKILQNAKKHGANCVVVACPMCHVNLDMKQADVAKRLGEKIGLPVYYLSDLVGLALGIDAKTLCIDKHFVAALA